MIVNFGTLHPDITPTACRCAWAAGRRLQTILNRLCSEESDPAAERRVELEVGSDAVVRTDGRVDSLR